MFVTFGILTDSNQFHVDKIIDSIRRNFEPLDSIENRYEVIVIGKVSYPNLDLRSIKVINDDNIEQKNWITKKKNLVVQHSNCQSEVIVIVKDYICFDDNWFNNLRTFSLAINHNWDILMCKIVTEKDNRRYLDWIWDNPNIKGKTIGRNVDYNVSSHPRMFVPGCLLIAKKYVLDNVKFSESLVGLNKPTDVRWSREAFAAGYVYKFNPLSVCYAFGKRSHRYPKFRKLCSCDLCENQ